MTAYEIQEFSVQGEGAGHSAFIGDEAVAFALRDLRARNVGNEPAQSYTVEDHQKHLPLPVKARIDVDETFLLQVLFDSIKRIHYAHYLLPSNADQIRVFRIYIVEQVLRIRLEHIRVVLLLPKIPCDYRYLQITVKVALFQFSPLNTKQFQELLEFKDIGEDQFNFGNLLSNSKVQGYGPIIHNIMSSYFPVTILLLKSPGIGSRLSLCI